MLVPMSLWAEALSGSLPVVLSWAKNVAACGVGSGKNPIRFKVNCMIEDVFANTKT